MNPFTSKHPVVKDLAEAAMRFGDTHSKEDWEELEVAALYYVILMGPAWEKPLRDKMKKAKK